MHLSMAYHARLGVTEAKVDNVIEFSDCHYPGLGCRGQFDYSFDFSKKCFITS